MTATLLPSVSSSTTSPSYASLTELILAEKERIFISNCQDFLSSTLGYPVQETINGQAKWVLKHTISATQWEPNPLPATRIEYFQNLARQIVIEGEHLITKIHQSQLEVLIRHVNKEWTSLRENNRKTIEEYFKNLLEENHSERTQVGEEERASTESISRVVSPLTKRESENEDSVNLNPKLSLRSLQNLRITLCPEIFDQAWVANEYPSLVIYNGRIFYCSEIAYLSQKYVQDSRQFEQMALNCCPESIRNLSQEAGELPLGLDWTEKRRVALVDKITLSKFALNPILKEKLLNTGSFNLSIQVEDGLWGLGGDGKGRNKLGMILQRVRDYFKSVVKS